MMKGDGEWVMMMELMEWQPQTGQQGLYKGDKMQRRLGE